MDTTYPTRPNWHELSDRRDELRTSEFLTRLPAGGRGDESNVLLLQRGIDAAAAESRFGLFKFAPIDDLAILLFNDVRKKFLHTEMMMGAIRTPSVYKMQEVDKNILAACGPSSA